MGVQRERKREREREREREKDGVAERTRSAPEAHPIQVTAPKY
jgi:hypothetical protein